jgi:hypothetical protein
MLWKAVVTVYRLFHLKFNPITYKPLHAQNDETNGSIEFLQPYPVVAAETMLEIGTAVISAVLSLDEQLSQTNSFPFSKILLPIGVLLSYSVPYFLVRVRIAKCFTNSNKRFQYKVIYGNKQTLCSLIYHVRTCTAFSQLA